MRRYLYIFILFLLGFLLPENVVSQSTSTLTLNFLDQSLDTDLDTYCQMLINEGYSYLGEKDNCRVYEGKVLGVSETQVVICGSYDYKKVNNVGITFPEGKHFDRDLNDYEKIVNIFINTYGTPSMQQKSENEDPMTIWKFKSTLLSVLWSENKYANILYINTDSNISAEDKQKQQNFEKINWLNDGLRALEKGDYINAEKYLLKALSEEKGTFINPEHYIKALRAISVVYEQIGNYADAEIFYNQLLNLCIEHYGSENNDVYLDVLNDLCVLLLLQGDNKRTAQMLQKQERILRNIHTEPYIQYVFYYSTLGNLALNEKNFEEAILSFKKADNNIIEFTSDKERQYSASIYNNLCICYSELQMPDSAIKYGRQAMEIYKVVFSDTHPSYANALVNMAYAYSKKEAWMSALKLNMQARDIFVSAFGNEHVSTMHSNFNIGTNLLHLKRYSQAVDAFMQSLQTAKTNYKKAVDYMSEDQREQYWTLIRRFLDDTQISDLILTQYNLQPNVSELAYNNELFSKGLLLSSGNMVRQSVLESGDPQLISSYNELVQLKSTIVTMREIGTEKKEIDNLSQRADSLEKAITRKSAAFRQNDAFWNIDWHHVQNHLQDNQAAIEFCRFALTNDSAIYAALVLRKNSPVPVLVPLFEEKEIADQVNSIWIKLSPYLDGIHQIYFAAAGQLHQIPIENIFYDHHTTWSDHYEMVRLSSTRELVMEHHDKPLSSASLFGGIYYDIDVADLAAQSALYNHSSIPVSRALGDDQMIRSGVRYLPGTKKEVETINGILQNKHIDTQLFTSNLANEESVKALSGQKRSILHIATHGFYWSDITASQQHYFTQYISTSNLKSDHTIDPLNRSGLLFSGANISLRGHTKDLPAYVQDGILTAKEISLMDLRETQLVVLSACETGKGDVTGEGVFGLQRAFKMAGVQTILMTLWQVDDDATQLFMTFFFNHYTQGKSKRDAFRMAQQQLRNYNLIDYSDPVYWAGFVLLD